jgi:hypothetical protein
MALDPHRAGDHIEAIFYRGPERHIVDMELSARPIADVPATTAELAAQARANFAVVDGELAALFDGVTEAQAEYRPAPDEWNSKQIVAHLICEERDMQTWVAGYIDEGDVENVFHANGNERTKAIVSAYPTVALLTEELRREEAIMAELTATLPPKTAENKAFYFQLGNWVGNFQTHHREHFGNIRRLIDESRS